jgi:hypothetical protein
LNCSAPRGGKAAPKDKMRILVCAQSNAAIDELLLRIVKGGCINADGSQFIPKITRIMARKGKDFEIVRVSSLAFKTYIGHRLYPATPQPPPPSTPRPR